MHSEGTPHQHARTGDAAGPWTIALMALALVGLYLLMHPYLGITHDARLYTLQALNHLHPELYGNDVFLRYGSQDDYTFFTPLYAWIISWLGVEPAAALLTFISQMAFLAAAALVAFKLLPATSALVALGLLLLLPDHYGSAKIFSFLEEFVTPRMLAESLVLFGLAAWLRGWRKLSAALLACAMLSHPIMGLSGVGLLVSLGVVMPHWRRLWPPASLILLIVAIVAIAGWIPASWRLDDEWLGIVLGRAEYLSLANWTSDDWGRVATIAATLVIAARVLRGDMQRLALAALISTGALVLLALIGGDLLRIALIVQAQPWRALWLSTVIAIVTLPPFFRQCWPDTGLRRGGALLLAASWLSPSENLALLIAPLAVAAVACGHLNLGQRNVRMLLLGSYVVLAMILIDALAVSLLTWQAGSYNVAVSPWLDALRGPSTGGALPLMFLFAGWWIVRAAPRPAIPVLGVILALPVAAAAVPTASTWFDTRYDEELKAAFGTWRARIPPGSDVMWATDSSTGADSATSAWLLLERPSFVSRIQATTSLFSREAALEMRHRTHSILGLLPDIDSLYPIDAVPINPEPLALAPVCGSSPVKYIVTHASFTDATPIEAPQQARNPFRNLKLYICP